jgi:hypothetical protein
MNRNRNRRKRITRVIIVISLVIAFLYLFIQLTDRALLQGDYKLCISIKEIHNQPSTECEKFNPKHWTLF